MRAFRGGLQHRPLRGLGQGTSPASFGGGVPPAVAALSAITTSTDTGTATTYAPTGVSLGAADWTRQVICAIMSRTSSGTSAGAGIASASIGGVAATVHIADSSNANGCSAAIISAYVPQGATGTISVTFNGAQIWFYCAVYRAVTLLSAAAFHTASANGATPQALSLNTPANGIAIACSSWTDSATAVTTAGVTEDGDAAFDSDRIGYGSVSGLGAQTGRAISFDVTADTGAAVAASWQ